MECLSDRNYMFDPKMTLSYDRRSEAVMANSGSLTGLFQSIKQEPHDKHHHLHHQTPSPPLNNNTTSSSNLAAVAAAASMSMFTPQQMLAQQMAIMASMYTPALSASMYSPLLQAWGAPQSASSPPLLHHSPGPVSPALSTQSSHSARKTPTITNINNNHSNTTNNNVVTSSSMTKKINQVMPKKRNANKMVIKNEMQPPQITVANTTTVEGTVSPPISISPGAMPKDGSRDKVFTCGVCSRSFGYKHVLQNHERTHTGEKPFKCPECHKRFTRDHHLKTHMRLHTGEKPYHCQHCDRQFVQVANLRRHLRVHTGERPYACGICNSKFSDSNQLKAHALTHKNEKPFKCEHCPMSFRRRHHLTGHKCSGVVTMLPSSMVSTHMANSMGSASDYEEDADVDDESISMRHQHKKQRKQQQPMSIHRPITPPTTSFIPTTGLPLNLSYDPCMSAGPEQTEPEDLSMATSRSRSDDQISRSSGSPVMSHSSPGGCSEPLTHEEDSFHAPDDEEVKFADLMRNSSSPSHISSEQAHLSR